MKNKINLLILTAITTFSSICLTTNKNVDNDNLIIKNIESEKIKVNKFNKETSVIDFNHGTGEEYLSNVKIQYGKGTNDNTSSLRFVSAIKGTISSYSSVTLPGQYGFHISYTKTVNDKQVIEDKMYDVEYVYHSISETIEDKLIYYTNSYSNKVNTEGRKTIQDFASGDYNLFIALKLDNITSSDLDKVISVQPYLKLENGEILTSKNYRYTTTNNVKNLDTGYYIKSNNSLISMEKENDEYKLNLSLVKNQTISLVNNLDEEVNNYTSIKDGQYYITYQNDNFKVLAKEEDVILEAEDGVYDQTSTKTFQNALASGGLGACDMNNCGQGITLLHYSYFEGTYEVEINYWTGEANSKQSIFVNNQKQATVLYTENNGWAPEGVKPATITVSLSFKKGWNSISMFKDGTSTDSPAYGGYVMLDYLKVKAQENHYYDPVLFDETDLSYRVEAEQGHFEIGGNLPQSNNNASGGYFVGNFDAKGKYVEFKFKAPLAGEYDLQIGYAKSNNKPTANILLNDELVELINFDNYENEAWDHFNLNTHKTRLTLSNEINSIKVAIEESWFCFDYIILTYVK